MFSFKNNCNTKRIKFSLNACSYLMCQVFLNLKSSCIVFNATCKLADTNDLVLWNVCHMSVTKER